MAPLRCACLQHELWACRGLCPLDPWGLHPSSQYIVYPSSQYIVYPSSQHIVYPSSQYIVYPSSQHIVYPSSQHIVYPSSQYIFYPSQPPIIPVSSTIFITVLHIPVLHPYFFCFQNPNRSCHILKLNHLKHSTLQSFTQHPLYYVTSLFPYSLYQSHLHLSKIISVLSSQA